MIASEILDINPSDIVLDLCASPGGKSSQIASKLYDNGLLISNDLNSSRIPQLIKNIERMGIKNSIITNESPKKLSEKWICFFDKILVDAPCSGEGMFRKDRDSILAWDKNKSIRMSEIQIEILNYAAKMLKNGGEIVYSTCTFSKIENEDIIFKFLQNNLDFEHIYLDYKKFGVSVGFDLKSLRIFPHLHKGEGHFVAKLRKKDGDTKSISKTKIIKIDLKSYKEFSSRYLKNLYLDNIVQFKGSLYKINPYSPLMDGIKVIRPGFFLGIQKKDRFEPSQALSMGININEFSEIINLDINDFRINKFLNGETFEIDADDGYKLFCFDNFPIGFSKILNNRLKWKSK